jgi:hypothetical protein
MYSLKLSDIPRFENTAIPLFSFLLQNEPFAWEHHVPAFPLHFPLHSLLLAQRTHADTVYFLFLGRDSVRAVAGDAALSRYLANE